MKLAPIEVIAAVMKFRDGWPDGCRPMLRRTGRVDQFVHSALAELVEGLMVQDRQDERAALVAVMRAFAVVMTCLEEHGVPEPERPRPPGPPEPPRPNRPREFA